MRSEVTYWKVDSQRRLASLVAVAFSSLTPFARRSQAEAEDFLWRAVEEYVPGARDRAVEGTVQVGTPLTHERFLRRPQGSYGPRAVAGENSLPPHKAKGAEGLWFCGDYFFPGIGVPAAAAGGSIVANSIVDVGTHKGWLDKIRLPAPA